MTRPTGRLVTIRLEPSHRQQQYAGQHFVVRLTADDGYTATRSYSVASDPDDDLVEICVEKLPDGEVSGYLYDVVEPGDTLEVRGPIGGWFVWDGSCPAVAVGGGTGVVPLVAMLRQAQRLGVTDRLRLAVSGRTAGHIPYVEELRAAGATVALTGAGHRLSADDLRPLADGADLGFVCGSARFAEALSSTLVTVGLPVDHVRVERFGPTG
ncbi:FAD-binding oxidoreductase [Nakamurella deserti]|uniref:FAD-binding oxidoreductase n=1 Tax=Nakamurella deserti TaxID=2164074 RepID=UPI001F0BAE2C|nr:FAD-binding oxidoreductase [Nakamurella deserti]